MHRDGDVGEHRRRADGRDRDVPGAVGERVADRGQRLVELDVVDLEIGDDARAARAPVHDPAAAVEVALLGEVDEEAHHRARVALVHREAVAAVVERGAERAELAHDLAAVVADELPAALHEGLTADVLRGQALGREPAHHHRLERDAGVVVARLPERVEAAHAVPADEDVLGGAVQGMAHVQPVGDVRRRQADDEGLARVVGLGVVEAFRLPRPLPALLDALWLVERLHCDNLTERRWAFRHADSRSADSL